MKLFPLSFSYYCSTLLFYGIIPSSMFRRLCCIYVLCFFICFPFPLLMCFSFLFSLHFFNFRPLLAIRHQCEHLTTSCRKCGILLPHDCRRSVNLPKKVKHNLETLPDLTKKKGGKKEQRRQQAKTNSKNKTRQTTAAKRQKAKQSKARQSRANQRTRNTNQAKREKGLHLRDQTLLLEQCTSPQQPA